MPPTCAGAALGCVLLVYHAAGAPTARRPCSWWPAFAALGASLFDCARRAASRCAALRPSPTCSRDRRVAVGTRRSSGGSFRCFRILYVKGGFEARPLYEKWNSYSRVRVNGNPRRRRRAVRLGPERDVSGRPARAPAADGHRRQRRHGDDRVSTATSPTIDHLSTTSRTSATTSAPTRDALVIGAGGGRDVLSALAFGARSVDRRRDQPRHPPTR